MADTVKNTKTDDSVKEQPFVVLSSLNVNEHTEKKEGLTYLTWSWAWDVVKRHYPNASYSIWKNENGLPYVYDELTGYMVYTSVTIEDVTHEMWLPVMDSKNKAMKSKPYTYKTKFGDKTVDAATMFDINKTIMRCLVKNLAMFGLGLYIYAGEDIPSVEEEQTDKVPHTVVIESVKEQLEKHGVPFDYVLGKYGIKAGDEIPQRIVDNMMKNMSKIVETYRKETK